LRQLCSTFAFPYLENPTMMLNIVADGGPSLNIIA
jgi:hypothetical protein